MENYRNRDLPVEARVGDLLARMTLEEKVAQLKTCLYSELVDDSNGCTSIRDMELSPEKMKEIMKEGMGQVAIITACNKDPVDAAAAANAIQRVAVEETRLGIPIIFDAEAAVGLIARQSTHYAMPIGQASSFNPKLVKEAMELAREQMKAIGVREVFAPVIDIARDPRWGRMEETFGEDPYLVSSMGNAFIKGLQGERLSDGVASTVKHFLAYGMTEGGMNMASCNLSPRELLDVVAVPFEAAVKEAGVAGVMTSYNDIDGEPVTGSETYCRKLLRDQWGFKGLLVQDATAMPRLAAVQRTAENMRDAGITSIRAGVDLELMSDACYGQALIEAVKEGLVEERFVDEACARHLTLKFKLGLFDSPYVDEKKAASVFRTKERYNKALELARESIVLLKNSEGILPLKNEIGTLALIGPQADNLRGLFTNYSHIAIQDVFKVVAVDSMFANATDDYPIDGKTLFDAVRTKVHKNTDLVCLEGCKMDSADESGIAQAVEAAKKADVIVLAVGSVSGFLASHNCGEARDSATLRLPGAQEELVKKILDLGKPVVLVLIGGRVFGIEDLIHRADAVLEAWAPGEAGADAIADILFGDFNPAGRLPVSIPRHVGQVPVYYNHKAGGGVSSPHGSYTDLQCTPLFPFGFGLSYTEFRYGNLEIKESKADQETVISFAVQNSGDREGDEVVQIYIQDTVGSVSRPVKQLMGFARVHLEAKETCRILFRVHHSRLAFHGLDMTLAAEAGGFLVMVGASSEDIRLEGGFRLNENVPVEENAACDREACKRFFTEHEILYLGKEGSLL